MIPFLLHLATAILVQVGAYGACADDVAALPAEWRPDAYGYTLVCEVEHPVHPSHGLVQGYVSPSTRTIHLWGSSTWPTGYVLAHEVGHLAYGHTPGQAGAETEADRFATTITGINP